MSPRVCMSRTSRRRGFESEGSPAGSGNENEGLTAFNTMCMKNAKLFRKKAGFFAAEDSKWKLYENPYYGANSAGKSESVNAVPQPGKSQAAEGPGSGRVPCKQIGRGHESVVQRVLGKRIVRVAPPPFVPFSSRSNASQATPAKVLELQNSKLFHPSKEPQLCSNGFHSKLNNGARQGLSPDVSSSHELLKDATTSTNYNEHPIYDESLLASLRSDLQASLLHVNSLEQSRLSAQAEVDHLRTEIDAKREFWHRRVQAKVASTVEALKGEANEERNMNKQMRDIHQNLENNISEVKKSLAKVKHDLGKEKEARKLLKDIGDELEKEIEVDKVALRTARNEIAKARYESEQERKMLQMGEIWREEKVHTRLTQVRYEVEEKAMIMDELRHKLETFLTTRRAAYDRSSGGSKQETMPKERPQNSLKRTSQASSLPSRPGTPSSRANGGSSPKVESGGQATKQRRWNF